MAQPQTLTASLRHEPKCWLVTGVAGFIGSSLLEALLKMDQRVVGLDNLTTGHLQNLDEVKKCLGPDRWDRFRMIEGDIENLDTCLAASTGIDVVLHEAALGSVPRSIQNPLRTHSSNVNGFLNMLLACQQNKVKRLVYASSSSVYGDRAELPKVEELTGKPLSPYAVTKAVNELYATAFARCYGLQSIGLRYFNVFGPRQDPEGPYAAVIPKWIAAMAGNQPVYINGDGETSRDFCYVANVVQANLLAATSDNPDALDHVYNIAVGERCTLNQLFSDLKSRLAPYYPHLADLRVTYRDFRTGDVRHSHADISKAARLLGYQPTHRLADGLSETVASYIGNLTSAQPSASVGV